MIREASIRVRVQLGSRRPRAATAPRLRARFRGTHWPWRHHTPLVALDTGGTAADAAARPLAASVEIAAPPRGMWEVVSDIHRTGQCRRSAAALYRSAPSTRVLDARHQPPPCDLVDHTLPHRPVRSEAGDRLACCHEWLGLEPPPRSHTRRHPGGRDTGNAGRGWTRRPLACPHVPRRPAQPRRQAGGWDGTWTPTNQSDRRK
jgi:hypothetical protein